MIASYPIDYSSSGSSGSSNGGNGGSYSAAAAVRGNSSNNAFNPMTGMRHVIQGGGGGGGVMDAVHNKMTTALVPAVPPHDDDMVRVAMYMMMYDDDDNDNAVVHAYLASCVVHAIHPFYVYVVYVYETEEGRVVTPSSYFTTVLYTASIIDSIPFNHQAIDLSKIKLKILPLPLSPFQQLKSSSSSAVAGASNQTDRSHDPSVVVSAPHGSSGGSTKYNSNINSNSNSNNGSMMTEQLKHLSMVGSYPPDSSRNSYGGSNTTDNNQDNSNNNDNNVLDAFIKQQHHRQRLSSGESIDSIDMLSFGASTSADTMFGRIDSDSRHRGGGGAMYRFNQQQVDISQDMAAELEEDLPFIWTTDACTAGEQNNSSVVSHHHNGYGITSIASHGGMKTHHHHHHHHQQYNDSSSTRYVSSNQSVDASTIVNNMLQRQKGRSLNSAVSGCIDVLIG